MEDIGQYKSVEEGIVKYGHDAIDLRDRKTQLVKSLGSIIGSKLNICGHPSVYIYEDYRDAMGRAQLAYHSMKPPAVDYHPRPTKVLDGLLIHVNFDYLQVDLPFDRTEFVHSFKAYRFPLDRILDFSVVAANLRNSS